MPVVVCLSEGKVERLIAEVMSISREGTGSGVLCGGWVELRCYFRSAGRCCSLVKYLSQTKNLAHY